MRTCNALETLDPNEEVIVYCSNFGCTASVLAYQQLSITVFGTLGITRAASQTGRTPAIRLKGIVWGDCKQVHN
jgi:hypothetical protein